MQVTSDIFLGWERTVGPDGVGRDFYVRQLRDWKLSAPIEQMTPRGMSIYAGLCGWTLARAHARSGDRIALAAGTARRRRVALRRCSGYDRRRGRGPMPEPPWPAGADAPDADHLAGHLDQGEPVERCRRSDWRVFR